MFPSFIVGGLRVEIDLNSAAKALGVWTAEGITADDGSIDTSIGAGDSCRFGIVQPVPTTNNQLTEIDLYCEKNAGFNQITSDAGGGAFDGEEYDNLPARNADQSQLFKTYPTGGDATYSATIDYTAEGVECVVAFRLYSGV